MRTQAPTPGPAPLPHHSFRAKRLLMIVERSANVYVLLF